MGVSPVVTPLADGETVKPMVLKRLLTMPSRRHEAKASHSWGGSSISSKSKTSHGHSHQQEQHQVDVVFMTLWFWSTAPVPRDFLPLTRRFAPHAKVCKKCQGRWKQAEKPTTAGSKLMFSFFKCCVY